MANTWPGMNSGGLAVGPWAQKRRGEQGKGEVRGGGGRSSESYPSGFLQQGLRFVLKRDKSHSEHEVP